MINPEKQKLMTSLVKAEDALQALRREIANARNSVDPRSEEAKRLAHIHAVLYADDVAVKGNSEKLFDLVQTGINIIEANVKPKPAKKTEQKQEPKSKNKLPDKANKVLSLLKTYQPDYVQRQRIADECRLTLEELKEAMEPLYKRNLIDGDREIRYIGA